MTANLLKYYFEVEIFAMHLTKEIEVLPFDMRLHSFHIRPVPVSTLVGIAGLIFSNGTDLLCLIRFNNCCIHSSGNQLNT